MSNKQPSWNKDGKGNLTFENLDPLDKFVSWFVVFIVCILLFSFSGIFTLIIFSFFFILLFYYGFKQVFWEFKVIMKMKDIKSLDPFKKKAKKELGIKIIKIIGISLILYSIGAILFSPFSFSFSFIILLLVIVVPLLVIGGGTLLIETLKYTIKLSKTLITRTRYIGTLILLCAFIILSYISFHLISLFIIFNIAIVIGIICLLIKKIYEKDIYVSFFLCISLFLFSIYIFSHLFSNNNIILNGFIMPIIELDESINIFTYPITPFFVIHLLLIFVFIFLFVISIFYIFNFKRLKKSQKKQVKNISISLGVIFLILILIEVFIASYLYIKYLKALK